MQKILMRIGKKYSRAKVLLNWLQNFQMLKMKKM